MRERGRRRCPGRLLAPLALVVAVGATVVVITTSTSSDGGGESTRQTTSRGAEKRQQQRHQRQRPVRASYTVKLNDTLGLISQKTGVSVERLQALNPDLDPQNLVVGQKIKLRE
jgi:LysM repeat protein